MKPFLLRLVACLFVVVSSSSHAALYDRGNGLIYDDVLDITWMQDANYAATTDYALANGTGALSLDDALTFVNQINYLGHTNWRLPSAGTDLYHNNAYGNGELELLNDQLLNYGQLVSSHGTGYDVAYNDASSNSIRYFHALRNVYRYSESYALDSTKSWTHKFAGTDQSSKLAANQKHEALYAWAVHDGDIGAAVIPIPTTAWLFGSALAGLLVARSKNKK